MIVGENLTSLVRQYSICAAVDVDDFSISIKLGDQYFEPTREGETIIYGVPGQNPEGYFCEEKSIRDRLVLQPGERVISCSAGRINMPKGYFGLLQTKGTLARLFVQATCNDGQVEPGFEGYVTLELVNLSPWRVEFPRLSEIGQLYVFKCSSVVDRGYQGRYAERAKTGPTLPIFR